MNNGKIVLIITVFIIGFLIISALLGLVSKIPLVGKLISGIVVIILIVFVIIFFAFVARKK